MAEFPPTVASTGGPTPMLRDDNAGLLGILRGLFSNGILGGMRAPAAGILPENEPPWSQMLGTLAHAATDIPGAGVGLGAILGPGIRRPFGQIRHDILSQGEPVGNISLRENPSGLYVENVGAGPQVMDTGRWTA